MFWSCSTALIRCKRAPDLNLFRGTTDTLPADDRRSKPLPASPGCRCPGQTSGVTQARARCAPPALPVEDHFNGRQIHQNAIFRQRRKFRDNLLRHMNRYADDNHSGVFHQLRRVRPVLFLQNTHLIARKRQHFQTDAPSARHHPR